MYCEGNPINNLDPSGQFTIIEFVTITVITVILSDIVFQRLSVALYEDTIRWSGTVVSLTLGFVIGIGIHMAHLSSELVDGEKGRGLFLIIVGGVTVGVPLMPGGTSEFELALDTPKIFGPKPGILKGPVLWISASLIFLYKEVSPLIYGTTISRMGFGRTPKDNIISKGEGWDIGIDVMWGISFLLL